MKFHLLLAVGLLLVSFGASDSSTDSTTVATTPAGTSTAGGSTATDTVSTAATGGTETTGATDATGATTATGATGASAQTTQASSDQPTTVISGSTVSSAPTTQAPLPNVTVSLLQFASPTCDGTVCTYELDAPGNNQAFLATEQTVVQGDRVVFGGLQSSAASKDAKVKEANDDAVAKMKELQALIDSIQSNLNSIQGNIQTIKSQQNDALLALGYVEKFIQDVNNVQDSCLYMRCLKPTTPAPPTTTPTPSPTTPPSPCVSQNFTCPDDVVGSTHCQLDNSNQPYCDNCVDNFDGYKQCNSVSCSAQGNPIVAESNGNTAWYSAGYNSTSSTSSVVPANSDCVWQLVGPWNVEPAGPSPLSLACLASGKVQLSITNSAGLTQTIVSTTTARGLNSILGKNMNYTFTLTSTGSDPTFCLIPLKPLPASSSQSFQNPEKPNGFFSWLMGY